MDVGATPDLMHKETFAELGATGPMVRTFLLRDRQFRRSAIPLRRLPGGPAGGRRRIEFYDQAGVLLKTVRIAAQEEKAA